MELVNIEGRQPVLEALKAGRHIRKIMVAEGSGGNTLNILLDHARMKDVRVEVVPKDQLDKSASTAGHQGVIALGEAVNYVDLHDIIQKSIQEGTDPFIVVLDQIQDPQNFGSIIRSAEAAGVHGIIIPKKNAVTITPTVEKASAGAVNHTAVARNNIAASIDFLKSHGCWIIGTSPEAEKHYFEWDYTSPTVIVIGSEGEGMRRLVREKSDMVVKLPMSGRVNSINAANAASILMYEVVRQRMHKG